MQQIEMGRMRIESRWIGMTTVAVAGALLPFSAHALDTPCELHVTAAGYPNRALRPSAFVKVTTPPGGAIFTTTNVASAFDDAGLQALMPSVTLKIIRHTDMLNLDERKIDGTRIYASNTACYADLVIDNSYAILTDRVTRRPLGILPEFILGDSRLVVSFLLTTWSTVSGKPVTYKKRIDSPIAATTAEIKAGNERARADLKLASVESLKKFAALVTARSAK